MPLVPAGAEQGEIASELIIEIGIHLRATGQGGKLYTAEAGFVLARNPDTLVAPDVAYVSADRLPPPDQRHGYLHLTPDLAVEIISPSNRPGEMADKVRLYLNTGARLVWVFDPRHRTIAVHTPDAPSRTLRKSDTLDGGDVLPDFRIAVAGIFP